MFNPKALELKNYSEMRESEAFHQKTIPAADKASDDPLIREVRRRLIGFLEEMNELNYI